MKSFRVFTIIFSVIICSLNAYSHGRHFKEQSDSVAKNIAPPATHTIILSVNPDGSLHLSDPSGQSADTIDVVYDDEIVWISNPDIEILNVKEKHKIEHFKDKPTGKNKWHGKVKNWPDQSYHETMYLIIWKDRNGRHKYDPLIRINPSHPIQ